jgi:hypothetical protein
MLYLQFLPQALTSTIEMNADSRGGGPEDPSSVPSRVPGVVMQNDSASLLRRKLRQRSDEVDGRLRHLDGDLMKIDLRGAALQLSPSDLEGRPPHPLVDVSDLVAAPEGLGVGLGHRVACHIGIRSKQQKRTPELGRVLPKAALNLVV